MNEQTNDLETFNIPNYLLLQTVDVNQYCENDNKLSCFLVSTNYDGSIIVAILKQQNSKESKLFNFIFEKQSYVFQSQSIIYDENNYISNLILNREGNILLIEYYKKNYDFYYKWSRGSKWVKFKSQCLFRKYYRFSFGSIREFDQPQQIESTSYDLSVVSSSTFHPPFFNYGVFVESFNNSNRNCKLIQKFYLETPTPEHSLVCKEKNFFVVSSGITINFFTLTTRKQLQHVQMLHRPLGIKLSYDEKLYVLLEFHLQILGKKNNNNYENILIIGLNHEIFKNMSRFGFCKDKIFFVLNQQKRFKDKIEVYSKSLNIFEIKQDELLRIASLNSNLIQKYGNNPDLIMFPNNCGFILQFETIIQFFQCQYVSSEFNML